MEPPRYPPPSPVRVRTADDPHPRIEPPDPLAAGWFTSRTYTTFCPPLPGKEATDDPPR